MKLLKFNLLLLVGFLLFFSGCFSKTSSDLLPKNEGVITGKVLELGSDKGIADVNIAVDYQGRSYSAKTEKDGSFALNAGLVERNSGVSLNLIKEGYTTKTEAAVFDLVNGRIELGEIFLTKGIDERTERKISGCVKADFGNEGIAGATVKVLNSKREMLSAVCDASGNFELKGYYLLKDSSYNLIVEAENYFKNNNTIVKITAERQNVADIHLYKKTGILVGKVFDQKASTPFENVSVKITDSNGRELEVNSDNQGNFSLKSEGIYIAETYVVKIEKTGYLPQQLNYTVSQPGEQSVGEFVLQPQISLVGQLQDKDGNPLSGVNLELESNAEEKIIVQSGADGSFSFSNANGINLVKGEIYKIKIAENNELYSFREKTSVAIELGENNLGIIKLLAAVTNGVPIEGKVCDYWYQKELSQKKGVKATVTIIDDEGSRSAVCDEDGSFILAAQIKDNDDGYDLKISAEGYTARGLDSAVDAPLYEKTVHIAKSESTVEIAQPILLYPLGIRCTEGDTPLEFSADLKQSREKFLTNKIGFTLSARDQADLNTASSFYLHLDEKGIRKLPTTLPENFVHSTLVTINGAAVRGAIASGYSAEEKNRPIKQKPSKFNINVDGDDGMSGVLFHFYVANPGNVTVKVTGLNNKLAVFDNDVSSVANGTDNLTFSAASTGWYFVKVKGATDKDWGFFNLNVTCNQPQTADKLTAQFFETEDLIISYYKYGKKKLYIAGKGEKDSTGNIQLKYMGPRGDLAYGTFSGSLKSIERSANTAAIAHGYFNVVRGE